MDKTTDIITLDYEWVTLIKKAKDLGMTAEEVRVFLSGAEETAL